MVCDNGQKSEGEGGEGEEEEGARNISQRVVGYAFDSGRREKEGHVERAKTACHRRELMSLDCSSATISGADTAFGKQIDACDSVISPISLSSLEIYQMSAMILAF